MGILGLIAAFIGNLFQMFGQQSANQQNLLAVQQANATNERINQTQMQHEDEAAEAADQRTRALYRDIESPKAKVNALMDAGLSPGLMYGQGGVGGSLASGAQAQTQGLIPAMAPQMQNIMGLLNPNMMTEALKAEAEIENIKADTRNKEKDLTLKDQMKQNLEQQVLEMRQNINESMMKVEKLFAEKQNEYKKGANLEAEKELIKAQTDYQNAMKELTDINIKSQADINEANLKLIKAKTAEAYAAAKKAGAETATIEAMRQQQVNLLVAQAQIAAFDALNLKPEELKMFKANVEKIVQENASQKAMADIYGGWKGKARADAAKSWLDSIANIVRAGASVAGAMAK